MAEIEIELDHIRESAVTINQESFAVAIMKEKQGERYFPMTVGVSELDSIFMSESIMMGKRGPSIPPLTHDLICTIICALKLEVERVTIGLKDGMFSATLVLASHDKSYNISCRFPDALAVAVRLDAPIFTDEKVLREVGVRLDPITGLPIEEV